MTTITVDSLSPIVTISDSAPSVTASAMMVTAEIVDESSISVSVATNQVVATVSTQDVTVDVQSQEINVDISNAGLPGPRGPSGILTFPFQYNNVFHLSLYVVPANKVVLRVEICLTTAFNGTSPSLSVGDAGNYQRLMTQAEIEPDKADTFTATPGISYGSDTQVYLTINGGSGGTAGEGIVTLIIQG